MSVLLYAPRRVFLAPLVPEERDGVACCVGVAAAEYTSCSEVRSILCLFFDGCVVRLVFVFVFLKCLGALFGKHQTKFRAT